MIRLQRGVNGTRQATVAFKLAGGSCVAWDEAAGDKDIAYRDVPYGPAAGH